MAWAFRCPNMFAAEDRSAQISAVQGRDSERVISGQRQERPFRSKLRTRPLAMSRRQADRERLSLSWAASPLAVRAERMTWLGECQGSGQACCIATVGEI
jgi:hypothetical protein